MLQQILQFLPFTAFVFQNLQDFLIVFVRVVQFPPPLVEKLVLFRLDKSIHDRLLQLNSERQVERNVFLRISPYFQLLLLGDLL